MYNILSHFNSLPTSYRTSEKKNHHALEPLNASLCSTEVCLVVGSMSLLDPAAAEDMTKVDESGETVTTFNK